MADLPADLFEWRMDCFFGDPLDALPTVREGLGGKPLLCTLRTCREGGAAELSPEEYEGRLTRVIAAGGIWVCGHRALLRGRNGCCAWGPWPGRRGWAWCCPGTISRARLPREEIAATLVRMKELGADLPKYAVMPPLPRGRAGPALGHLAGQPGAVGPVITMSMGELGKVSRACGGMFGSCLTFGAGQNASAPGQLNAEDLRAILEDLQPYGGAQEE